MARGSPFSAELVHVRRNPWAAVAALTPLLAVLVGGLGSTKWFNLLPHALIGGVALGVTAWKSNWWGRRVTTRVRANGSGVTIGDELVPRATIKAGLVMPGSPPYVWLRRHWLPPIQLAVENVDQGRALLRALRLDASQAVASFGTLSRVVAEPAYTFGIGAVVAAVYLGFITSFGSREGGPLHALAPFALGATVLAGLFVIFFPGGVRVGADGIAWSWLGQTRFIAYEDIEIVSTYERGWGRSHHNGLLILLKSEGEVRIPIARGRLGTSGETHLVEERIREAMEASKTGGAAADSALLRRGERAIGAWVAALRALGSGANIDMRTAPVPRERLFRIVEDAALPAVDRAAAVVALATELDDDGRARLRQVASSTAGSRLRIAIEAAASSASEAEMEAALDEIAAEPERARAG